MKGMYISLQKFHYLNNTFLLSYEHKIKMSVSTVPTRVKWEIARQLLISEIMFIKINLNITYLIFSIAHVVNTRTTDSQHEAISTKTSENDWSLKNT